MAADRLPKLRRLLREASDKLGTITVGTAAAYGTPPPNIQIGSRDLQAILSLLIERDSLLLASFNVRVETSA